MSTSELIFGLLSLLKVIFILGQTFLLDIISLEIDVKSFAANRHICCILGNIWINLELNFYGKKTIRITND